MVFLLCFVLLTIVILIGILDVNLLDKRQVNTPKKHPYVFGIGVGKVLRDKEYILYSFHTKKYYDLFILSEVGTGFFIIEDLKGESNPIKLNICSKCFLSTCKKYEFNYFKSANTGAYYILFDDEKQFKKFKDLFI